MKILSPKEIKDEKTKEFSRDTIRTKTLKETISNLEQELNLVEARFDLTLKNQGVVWSGKETEHLDIINGLKTEIKHLEGERQPLLVPIEYLNKEAHTLFSEAEKALERAQGIEEENQNTSDLLQDKLDAISEYESDLKDREYKVISREKEIDERGDILRNLSAELDDKWNDFYKESEKRSAEIGESHRTLEVKQINLETRENLLEQKEEENRKESQKISSERLALKSAFNELNNGKNRNISREHDEGRQP